MPRASKNLRTKALIAGAAIWIIAPLAGFVALSIQSASLGTSPPRPVFVEVKKPDEELNRRISLGIRWGAPVMIPSPGFDGLVQETLVEPGAALVDGSPLARVGGIVRSLAVTPWPFDRVLGVSSSGGDVRMLTEFLARNGFGAAPGDVFDSDTLSAVRRFAESIGVPAPGEVTSFDPQWVVFSPRAGKVSEWELTVGAPAPSLGTALGKLTPDALEAVLWEEDAPAPPQDSMETPLVATIVAMESETLTVAGEPLSLSDDRTSVDTDQLPLLSALLSSETTVAPANLLQSAATGQWQIPSAALISEGSTSCVHARRSGLEIVVEVKVFVALSGEVVIDADLREGDEAIVYPLGQEVSCS